MDGQFAAVLLLGLMLGMQHATDPDHIVAVSTFVTRTRSLGASGLVGLAWGVGHTLTLALVGLGVVVFKLTIPAPLALSMEFVVGIMLTLLGGGLLRQQWQRRDTAEADAPSAQGRLTEPDPGQPLKEAMLSRGWKKPMAVGMVHGLAGSATLMLIVLASVRTVPQALTYIVIFGIGSIGGMAIISGLVGLPVLIGTLRYQRWIPRLRVLSGAVSVGLGVAIMAQVGWGVGWGQGLF